VVAGPGRAAVPASPYRVSVPDGDLSTAVGQFLAAFLTGAGEVDRYFGPGVNLPAVSPAPYTAVSIQHLSAVAQAAAAEQMSGDGAKVRVLAPVEARESGGR
jgi:hypothetical protein